MPSDVLRALGGAYREFQAAMIAGIGLILDPHGSNSLELHEILDAFLRDHEGLHETDATTRRELTIIEFLKKKAESGPEEAKFRPIPDGNQSQVQAQANASLLMGLSGQTFGLTMSNHRDSPHSASSKPTLPALQQPIFHGAQSTPSPRSPMDSISPHHGRHQSRGGQSGGSGGGFTPPNEEAQNLLDNWCNSVINSSGYGPDGSAAVDFPSPWVSAPTPMPYTFNPPQEDTMEIESGGVTTVNGFEAADWNYWDAIVNAVRDGAAPA